MSGGMSWGMYVRGGGGELEAMWWWREGKGRLIIVKQFH